MKNKYTESFINELHNGICSSTLAEIPSQEDYAIIDEVIRKYYSSIFNNFYNKDSKYTKFTHNPELAYDFNIMLINLIIEAVRLLFYKDAPYTSFQKALFFEALIKTIGKEINKLEQQKFSAPEIIENIIGEIDKEYKRITDNHSFNMTDYSLSIFNIVREYMKQKITYIDSKRYDSFVFFEDDFRSFSNFVIIFSIAALLPAIFLNPENIYFQIMNKIILILIILISFVFPGLIIHIQKTFVKMKLFYNPYNYYQRLGTDTISIHVCGDEIIYTDPEQKNLVLPALADVRLNLTDKYGFVLPLIRVWDSSAFKTGYKIFLHSNEILHLDISMEDLIITDEKVKEYNITINENYIKKETEFGTFYTINKKYEKDIDKNIFYTGVEYLKEIMKKTALKYINLIFTIEETFALLELYSGCFPAGYKIISQQLNIYELKEIFIKLLQKHCSLKDIVYVMEKIIKYSKTSKDTDYIAFQIYDDMIKDKFIVE
ncbi:MAG: FHIPEP family type III secretion protein [Candidatus Avigastranaerophilus sp.]